MIIARLSGVGKVVLILDHGRWSPVWRDALTGWIHTHAVRVAHIATFGGRRPLISLWVKLVQNTELHDPRGIRDIGNLIETHVAIVLLKEDCWRRLK